MVRRGLASRMRRPAVSPAVPFLAVGDGAPGGSLPAAASPGAAEVRHELTPGEAARAKTSARGVAVLYLGALAAVELATRLNGAAAGLIGHAAVVVAIMAAVAHATFTPSDPPANRQARSSLPVTLLTVLAVPPTLRGIGLALPLADATALVRILAVTVPGIVAALAAKRAVGYRWSDLRLRPRFSLRGAASVPLFGAAGVVLGYAASRVAPSSTFGDPAAQLRAQVSVALALLLAAFVQELILRGLVLRAAERALGATAAVLFTAVLGVILSVVGGDVAVAALLFAVGLGAGAMVVWTGSLFGVILIQSVAAVCWLLVFPALASVG